MAAKTPICNFGEPAKPFSLEGTDGRTYTLEDVRGPRAYDAVCTPDFFGYDRDLELQYRGRLDESKSQPVQGAARDLYDAMVEVAATGRGPEDQIPSMGCSIKWKAA
jgi:hypothetical protein